MYLKIDEPNEKDQFLNGDTYSISHNAPTTLCKVPTSLCSEAKVTLVSFQRRDRETLTIYSEASRSIDYDVITAFILGTLFRSPLYRSRPVVWVLDQTHGPHPTTIHLLDHD